ncbi:MAG: BRCT domain-containing protein, partial [Synechocystis sp.]
PEVLPQIAAVEPPAELEPEVIADQVETVTPEEPVVEAVAQPESVVEIEPESVVEPEPVKAEATEDQLTPEPSADQVNLPETETTAAVEAVSESVIASTPESTLNPETVGPHLLVDKKVVILGTLNAMNRETAKTRLQDLGAECTSAPSSKTDYVVVGKAPGVKLKKAQKLGIAQLSEAQFLELLGD